MAKTSYLAALRDNLKVLDMPIYWKLPKPAIEEPFIVIGYGRGNTMPSAKTNRAIRDDMQQVDIFLSADVGRVAAENIQSRAIEAIGKSRYTNTELLVDDTVGREVYHIVIQIYNFIF